MSFNGDKNTDVIGRQCHIQRHSGATSIRTSSGNAAPSASNNKLGVNPGLDFSDIKSMAAKLGNARFRGVRADAATDTRDAGGRHHRQVRGYVLNGKAGNDSLSGKAGADKLYGKAAPTSSTAEPATTT